MSSKQQHSENSDRRQGLSGENESLVEEFCCLVATIAIRVLTRDSAERDNCSTVDEREADEQ